MLGLFLSIPNPRIPMASVVESRVQGLGFRG